MNLGIDGKTALVVGATRGIGREIAKEFAREGARVIAVGRTESLLHSLVEEIGSGKCIPLAIDLVPEDGPASLLSKLSSEKIEIVINCVGGTLNVRNPFCETVEFRRVMRLNLEIAMELNAKLVEPMIANGWGRVVHISSNAALTGTGAMAYGVAKAALNGYVENVGKAIASKGIVMTAVAPGPVIYGGSSWEKRLHENPERTRQFFETRFATQRPTECREVASLVLYLCSTHSSNLAGSVMRVDGGLV